jgi:hypothetical protein
MMQLEFGLDSNLNREWLRTGMSICKCGEKITIPRSGHFSSTLKWIGLGPEKKGEGRREDREREI